LLTLEAGRDERHGLRCEHDQRRDDDRHDQDGKREDGLSEGSRVTGVLVLQLDVQRDEAGEQPARDQDLQRCCR
jgi:hypothetical protein